MADATYERKVYHKNGGDELVVASGGAVTVESGGSIAAAAGSAINVAAGAQVVHAGEITQTKSANYTMTEADSGKITYVDTDAVVITLPATVVGYSYTFVNSGADGAVGFALSPNASDKIMGNGYTAADDKDVTNTKATAKKGDRIEIIGDGVNGWFIRRVVGIWAKEA